MSNIPVLTIDGPGDSGKGTISLLIAQKLGWHMLDSGALYRLVAFGAVKHQIDLQDEAKLADYARTLFNLGQTSRGGRNRDFYSSRHRKRTTTKRQFT